MSGIKPTPLYNLKVKRPELAKQWLRSKNFGLKPEDFTPFSQKYVWWKCDKGHEWESQIKPRSYGEGCPYCAGRKVCEDNCLATIRPDVAIQWHKAKNSAVTPFQVTIGSNLKVWWQCEKGHEWQASIANRVNQGTGCPYCQGKRITSKNSLALNHPLLVRQWHSDKNGTLKPEDFSAKSSRKIWWRCEKGHEWETRIERRVAGTGCPKCKKGKATESNNLLRDNPTLCIQWNLDKNGTAKPEDFVPGSHKKVWWICSNGHEWVSAIRNRVKGSRCPICKGKKM